MKTLLALMFALFCGAACAADFDLGTFSPGLSGVNTQWHYLSDTLFYTSHRNPAFPADTEVVIKMGKRGASGKMLHVYLFTFDIRCPADGSTPDTFGTEGYTQFDGSGNYIGQLVSDRPGGEDSDTDSNPVAAAVFGLVCREHQVAQR
jgi:hypothetical protein